MDVRIIVETTFKDGKTQRRNIGRLCRSPDELESENLGLRLDESKNFLGRLQKTILQSQIDEALATSRICDSCGKRDVAPWI